MKKFLLQNKEPIAYVFFGGCTTLINWAVYYLCYNVLSLSNVISVIIAWLLSVIFAFFTNKKWVFNSSSFSLRVVLRECGAFFAVRIATGILDVVIMWIAVDVFNMNATLWKLLSNIIIIIINYAASKLFVFKG